MSVYWGKRLLVGGVLLAALALGGCSTSVADLPLFGNASDPHAKDAVGYLPVENLPPNRDEAAIAPDEQAQIKAELLAARDRQASISAKDPNNPANQPSLPNPNR